MEFSYQSYSNKVIFGKDFLQRLVIELSGRTDIVIMAIASPRYKKFVDQIMETGWIKISHFDKTIQHVPETLLDEALKLLDSKTNLLLAIGGGSATGLAKALALKTKVPIWAVPTTFSGSEMTNIYGISVGGEKVVGANDHVLPEKVFYDPSLFMGMPLYLASTSAINAIAHLIEALYSNSINAVSCQISTIGLTHMVQALDSLSKNKLLTEGIIESLMYGSFLGGRAMNETPMALQHKLAHIIGGTFNLDHSATHAVLLPYVLNYQWPFLNKKIKERLNHSFMHAYAPEAINKLCMALGLPTSLKELGLQEKDIPTAIELLCEKPFPNPAPVNPKRIGPMLRNAYEGHS